MGVVGRWDQALFLRFRDAENRAQRSELLGELARVHDRLVLKITRQLTSNQRTGHRGLAGTERLAWPDAVSAGRVAELRALQEYDPAKGGEGGAAWSVFLKWKIVDELQRAVQESAVVMRGRRRKLAEVDYLESDDELPAEEREPAAALRAKLEEFLDAHCQFAAEARVAAAEVRGRYESVVVAAIASRTARTASRRPAIQLAREAVAPGGELAAGLLGRGAQRTKVRVPWAPSPVHGFVGVRLQIAAGGDPAFGG